MDVVVDDANVLHERVPTGGPESFLCLRGQLDKLCDFTWVRHHRHVTGLPVNRTVGGLGLAAVSAC